MMKKTTGHDLKIQTFPVQSCSQSSDLQNHRLKSPKKIWCPKALSLSKSRSPRVVSPMAALGFPCPLLFPLDFSGFSLGCRTFVSWRATDALHLEVRIYSGHASFAWFIANTEKSVEQMMFTKWGHLCFKFQICNKVVICRHTIIVNLHFQNCRNSHQFSGTSIVQLKFGRMIPKFPSSNELDQTLPK